MKTDEYREHLRAQGASEPETEEKIAIIRAFEDGLRELGADIGTAGKAEIGRYAGRMIAEGSNTSGNFNTLAGYALWRGLRPQYVTLVEIADCHNGMDRLREEIEKRHGAEVRDRIFVEPIPPLGVDEAVRLAHTQAVTARMAELLTPEESRAAWFQVQHGISAESWRRSDAFEKERFADCETVDAFLKRKRQYRNEELKLMHDQGELYFTMELTDEVLEFLTGEQHMWIGEHNGRRGIVVTKIPYQTAQFLRETDERMKRYYACHCPIIREAILKGEPVSLDVCYCSLGYASHFLAGMGLEGLEGEVLESVAQGDARCRFIFYLPEETNA